MFLLSHDSWEIRQTTYAGAGVFAKKEIKAGTVIGDYLGTVINTADYDLDADKTGLYLMYYSDSKSIYPDLSCPGIHLVNHACVPNCWIYIHRGHTLFFSLLDINPGEELTISYLLDPQEGLCSPCLHVCRCGHPKCTGSMHLSRERFSRWQKFQQSRKKTRNAIAIVGKRLQKLAAYPEINFIHPIYKSLRV